MFSWLQSNYIQLHHNLVTLNLTAIQLHQLSCDPTTFDSTTFIPTPLHQLLPHSMHLVYLSLPCRRVLLHQFIQGVVYPEWFPLYVPCPLPVLWDYCGNPQWGSGLWAWPTYWMPEGLLLACGLFDYLLIFVQFAESSPPSEESTPLLSSQQGGPLSSTPSSPLYQHPQPKRIDARVAPPHGADGCHTKLHGTDRQLRVNINEVVNTFGLYGADSKIDPSTWVKSQKWKRTEEMIEWSQVGYTATLGAKP